MNRQNVLLGLVACVVTSTLCREASADEDFSYDPPGQLVPGSGEGRADDLNYAPGIRFPIEDGPAYANSQVWGLGGSEGGGGSQCDEPNYSYPWRDNYCESRSWDMPLCPAGVGHQGQDIRPGSCDDVTHWTVAAGAGTVTNVGSYSVYVTAPDGTRYDYLHGRNNLVSEGQEVAREERINQVSNAFGDGGWTTIHLHFNIKQDVAGVGYVYAPPYNALIDSYEELLGLTTEGAKGAVESKDCTGIVGWAQNLDAPDEAATLEVWFDGPREDPNAVGVEVVADFDRPDLCDALGSCTHGFEIEIPRRLRDGKTHPAYVYVLDGSGGATEAEESPVAFACAASDLPEGVKREIQSPEVLAAWGLSPFWDALPATNDQLSAIDDGPELPDEPRLVTDDDGEVRWLVDVDRLRKVKSPAIASAWHLDWDAAEPMPADALSDMAVGTPLPDEPFVLEAANGSFWMMDVAQCDLADPECVPPEGEDEPPEEETDTAEALPDGEGKSDQGCGCTTGEGSPGPAPWLVLFGFAARLRRGFGGVKERTRN